MLPRSVICATSMVLWALFVAAVPASAQTAPARAPADARATTPIGKVESLTGDVKIEHVTPVLLQASAAPGVTPPAKKGDFVFEGDIVQTGANSAVGIVFTDGTAFNLSSNARMTLDQYLYDANGKSNSTLFNLTKGTFTFVAGKVAKTGDMKIDTPVATMGIRGTAPHVEIAEDGSVKFSTLVEKGKNSPQAKPQTGGQRRAEGGRTAPTRVVRRAPPPPAPSDPAAVQAEKDLGRRLMICRGC